MSEATASERTFRGETAGRARTFDTLSATCWPRYLGSRTTRGDPRLTPAGSDDSVARGTPEAMPSGFNLDGSALRW
jgi:hypothetical protein